MPTTLPVPLRDEYAWADYLIYMEAGAEIPLPPKPEPRVYPVWWGVALVGALAILGYVIVSPEVGLVGKGLSEPVMFVLPLGILIGNLVKLPDRFKSGVRYAVKQVLMWGIILLGVRLHFGDVLKVGAAALLMSALQVVLMLALVPVIRRLFGISEKQATLLGIGTAICGGSAIIATAPVLDAEERDVAFAVATVSFLGLGVMFLLPVIGHQLGMDPRTFGIWAGLSIHQTPQVVAAGFAYDPDAGQAATLVKLARVCLLAPLVLALSFRYRKQQGKGRKLGITDFLPPMVIGFLILATANSLGLIPTVDLKFPRGSLLGTGWAGVDLAALFKTASGFAIAMGMAAVGLETSFRSLRSIGMRPFLGGLVMAIAAVLFSFAAIRVFV